MSHEDISDRELWQQVKQDDRSAFETLYRRYMRRLYSVIYKWDIGKADAEDILQEVFLDVWEKRRDIEIGQHVFNYFYTIARYKVFDHLKGRQLSAQQIAAWEQLSGPAIQPLAEITDTPRSLLDAEVSQLPPQMKRVYQLRFLEEKSIREIADELLLSPSTVKNHLQQIRKRLHTLIARLAPFLFSLFSLLPVL